MTKEAFDEEFDAKLRTKPTDHLWGEPWRAYICQNLHKLSTKALERMVLIGPNIKDDGGWSTEVIDAAATILLERAMV
jgi:hypothetical protein